MRRDLILRGGRVLRSGAKELETLDIRIGTNGRIAAIGALLAATDADEVREVGGQLVVPGLIDMHQHLDKSRTRTLADNPAGTLAGASEAYRAIAPGITPQQMMVRALQTIEACSVYGTVAIRSHTNIDPQTELRGIEAMIGVREKAAHLMRVQVVAHVTSGATSMLPESREWLRGAVALGVDVIGGVPAYSDQPIEFMKLLFDAADNSGLPLDMHIDEHLDETRVLFDSLIEMTRAYGMSGRVVAGHSSVLSALAPNEAGRVIEALAEGGHRRRHASGSQSLPAGPRCPASRPAWTYAGGGPAGGRSSGRCRVGQYPGSICSDGQRGLTRNCALDAACRATRSQRSPPGVRDGEHGASRPHGTRIGLGYPGGRTRGPADRRCRVGRGSCCRGRRATTNPDRRSSGSLYDPGT